MHKGAGDSPPDQRRMLMRTIVHPATPYSARGGALELLPSFMFLSPLGGEEHEGSAIFYRNT